MPHSILDFTRNVAVTILTGRGDSAHEQTKSFAIIVIHMIKGCRIIDSAGTSGPNGMGQHSQDAIIAISAIIDGMANITIRNLEETTKRKLKIRAAMNGRSMEQEAREILRSALARNPQKKANLAERVREIFSPLGGVDLDRLPREAIRDPEWVAEKE
jgi:antitoxin FitA